MNAIEIPEGIIITVSAGMYGEKGYRNWLRNFLDAMNDPNSIYWFRAGSQPKRDPLYLYLCIGGRIRYRVNYAGSEGPSQQMFDDGRVMSAKAWLVGCGPVARAPFKMKMKGFQGFRYCNNLF